MISTVNINNAFSLEPITANDISQQIKRLDVNEATILIISVENLQENFSSCILKVTFPNAFKIRVHPTRKKGCNY